MTPHIPVLGAIRAVALESGARVGYGTDEEYNGEQSGYFVDRYFMRHGFPQKTSG